MGLPKTVESIPVTAEPLFRRHRFTVYEYLRMAQEGILAPDARVELIEGEIIDMAPIGNWHEGIVDRLNRIFVRAYGEMAIVRCQSSVQLNDLSLPQPDFAILAPREDFYTSKKPSCKDTLLIVEVSDSTLSYDLQIKVPLYARHGVPEAWIVNIPDRQVHFFRSPVGDEYTSISTTDRPGMARAPGLPGTALDLSHLFT